MHPSHLRKQVTVVGGTKKVHVDKVAALKPDFVIANKEENTKEDIEAIEQLCPVYISDIKSPDDATELINALGEVFDITPLTDNLNKQLQEVIPTHLFENQRVAYLIWQNPYMTIGADTYIQSILSTIGLDNAFSHLDRYPQITNEDLKAANLDYVFLSSEPFPFKQKHIDTLASHLPRAKIMLVDGEAFSWYGTRLLKLGNYFPKLAESFQS